MPAYKITYHFAVASGDLTQVVETGLEFPSDEDAEAYALANLARPAFPITAVNQRMILNSRNITHASLHRDLARSAAPRPAPAVGLPPPRRPRGV